MMDRAILLWIQDKVRHSELTKVMRVITHSADHGEIWILTGLTLLCFKKSRKAGKAVLLSLLMSYLINNIILKNVIARTRPYEVVEGLTALIPSMPDYSFPSGHTACSFAAAISIYRNMSKRWGISALIVAAAIACSRLYLGVHYPTDILGGIIGGAAAAYAAEYLLKMYRDKKK